MLASPDPEGSFEIDHLPAGNWWVVACEKKPVEDSSRAAFTLRPVKAVEVPVKAGEEAQAVFPEPGQ